jgi:hypothetical protein
MTKLRLRTNGRGVPTQSQPQAASLTLSACNIVIYTYERFKKHSLRTSSFYRFLTESLFYINGTCSIILLHTPLKTEHPGKSVTMLKLLERKILNEVAFHQKDNMMEIR